jgi:soluble lytic murein transglycosylase-like protein
MIKKSMILICFAASCHAAILPLQTNFVTAEIQVESGGNSFAIGDAGKALGALQIHKAYWQDAVNYDRTIGGKYQDCTNKVYSIKIMTAYLNRYAKKAIENKDFETLARIHNGGLHGAKNPATLKYWHKIQKQINLIK